MTLYDDLNKYEIGDLVRVSGPFRNSVDGAPVDPTAVFLSYKKPDGTTTSLTYGVDGAVAVGIWSWRWHSTGIGQAADEGRFYVKPSLV
jgi:hypothetical protein